MIKAIDLLLEYGQNVILDINKIGVKKNAITGLVGKSGAGKTSILKILAGHLTQTMATLLLMI